MEDLQEIIYHPNINITKEWLVSVGFNLVPVLTAYGYDCSKASDAGLWLAGAWSDHTSHFVLLGILENNYHKEIKFTYQLQMIWYGLTGEWL